MLAQLPKDKLIIHGVTAAGEHFRPSDWAERMSGILATFQNHRISYSPMLHPSVSPQGYQCITVDLTLKNAHPDLYESILNFAKINNLKICQSIND
jgi:hypothetical protein